MTKTILLGATLAAVFVVTLVGLNSAIASVPGPAAFVVQSFAVDSHGNNAILSANTGGDITKKPNPFINSHPVVGIAWADLDTGLVFVTTIHPVLGRDSNQNPDAWHAHTATLGGGASGTQDFCVISIDSTPNAGIHIEGNSVDITVKANKLPFALSDVDAAVGFTIDGDSGVGCASGLAVTILT